MADERIRKAPTPLGNITQIKSEVVQHKEKIAKIEKVSDSLEKMVNEKLKEISDLAKELKMKFEMVEDAVAMKLKIMNEKLDKLSLEK